MSKRTFPATVNLSLILLVLLVISILVGPSYSIAQTQAGSAAVSGAKSSQTLVSLPTNFRWPWDKSENGNILWTSGPHSWSRGGVLDGRISASRGNGLDFAEASGESFAVHAMAAGVVIKNECGFIGLGCIVAIRHTVGGSVMIYAHLKQGAGYPEKPENDLSENKWIRQGRVIGYAGDTGGQNNVHLHIELRDGENECSAPAFSANGAINGNDCGDVGFAGNPYSWEGQSLVDGYVVQGYFDTGNGCAPGADCDTIFNYDGSAVRSNIAGAYIEFPYKDNGIPRRVLAFVHETFTCNSTTNCEINANDGTTLFADQGKFSGGGGRLYSSNQELDASPIDTTAPSASSFQVSVNANIANISVGGVADNPGGTGIQMVKYSAKWNNNWYPIGSSSVAPFGIAWDMCASQVPNTANYDVELGMEVVDKAGNQWIWSQHFTNPHILKNFVCTGNESPPSNATTWELNGWMNRYLAGYVNWQGQMTWSGYPYIWADWGGGAPFDGFSGDEWSLRFWRDVYFPGGDYQFGIRSDDGARIMLDGESSSNPTMNCWYDTCDDSRVRYVSPGWHRVTVEYYENRGDARLFAYWYGPGYPRPDERPPTGRISAPSDASHTNQSPLRLVAEASDDASGVERVVFFAWYCANDNVCDWRQIGTDYSAPYSIDWDWSSFYDQTFYFLIDVYDRTGKMTGSPGGWTRVTLDRTSPQTWFTQPGQNAHFTQPTIALQVDTADANRVANAQFFAGYFDGGNDYWHELGWDRDSSDSLFRLNWDSSSVPRNTPLEFFVWAYDASGNYGSASVSGIVVPSLDRQIRLLEGATWDSASQPKIYYSAGEKAYLVGLIENISGATQQVQLTYQLIWDDGSSADFVELVDVEPGGWYWMLPVLMPRDNGIYNLRVETLFMGNVSAASTIFWVTGAPDVTATPTKTPVVPTATTTPTKTPTAPVSTPTPSRTPTVPASTSTPTVTDRAPRLYIPLVSRQGLVQSGSTDQVLDESTEQGMVSGQKITHTTLISLPWLRSTEAQFSSPSASQTQDYATIDVPESRDVPPNSAVPEPSPTPSFTVSETQRQ